MPKACSSTKSIAVWVLTPAGETVARNIARRHKLLTNFLRLLGLNERVIHHDVEGMEHHISMPTLRAIEALTRQLRRRLALRGVVRNGSCVMMFAATVTDRRYS